MVKTTRIPQEKKPDRDELTQDQQTYLLLGYSFFNRKPFKDEAHCRESWFKFRDQLIRANWEQPNLSSDPDRGGWTTRPWGWWIFEAKENRRLIRGKFPKELLEHGYNFGLPRAWSHGQAYGCEWETQAEYLERLGLLTEEEKKALKNEENEVDKTE